MKWCPKCTTSKSLDEFHSNSSKKDGKSDQCKKCRRENRNFKREYKYNRAWRKSNPERALLHGARQRANKTGVDFDITVEDIFIPAVCPILSIPLTSQSGGKRHNGSATLDRVSNSLGYVKGNVEVISWRANRLKSDASIEELESVLRYMKERIN